MAENYKGMNYLRTKLAEKRIRVLVRYKYYNMKDIERDSSIAIPDSVRDRYKSAVGWCAKAVDSLSNRLTFRGFGNDNFDLQHIFDMNNKDVLFDSAFLGALISSCDFIYISAGEDGFPRLQVIDGSNATGIIDTVTNMLQEGYAVLERDDNGFPISEAYFVKGRTFFYQKGMKPYSIPNVAPYPLLVPVIYRPDASRPFGHSRITRACMDYQRAAKRTLERTEVSAEFYSYPQKYVTGLSQDAEPLDKWKASMSSMIEFEKDEDGDSPTVGSFTQQSMEPHLSELRSKASMFAGETGLTLDDLGWPSDNPSSADAIKASHENLYLCATKAQHSFGVGIINAGFLAACVRDNFTFKRQQIYLTKALWEPVFRPDSAGLSGIGDGAIKLNQAVPGYIGKENLRELTGIPSDTTE